MTYLNINLKLEELTEAVLNSDMNTLMKSLAITVFNAYMEEERHQFIQAAPHERSDQRQDYRNGYYERQWTLSIGPLNYKSHARALANSKPSSLNATSATNRPSCSL